MEIKNEEEQKLGEIGTGETEKGGTGKSERRKKAITVIAVLLCVGAAVYLNWSYNKSAPLPNSASVGLSDLRTMGEDGITEETASNADYFAQARLTRKQSRDEALSLLKATAASKTASKETIDGAMSAISAMANYSMQETQIENMLLAKNFAECVAFVSADGVTLAVPAPAEGLTAADVAKITDVVTSETDFKPTQIHVIEVKNGQGSTAGSTASPSPSANTQTTPSPSAAPSAAPSACTADTDDVSVLE
ncbi:MAG: SpoIIIAH-like family protein [Oscillospiraceae bacterium]|jgi:stage III sporulation protein AH